MARLTAPGPSGSNWSSSDVWGPQVCETFPEFPRLDVRFGSRFPKLDKMLVIHDNGTVDFAPVTAADDAIIKRLEDRKPSPATTLPFLGWMKSMIRWSNNDSAATVINSAKP